MSFKTQQEIWEYLIAGGTIKITGGATAKLVDGNLASSDGYSYNLHYSSSWNKHTTEKPKVKMYLSAWKSDKGVWFATNRFYTALEIADRDPKDVRFLLSWSEIEVDAE